MNVYQVLMKPENRKIAKAVLGILLTVSLLVPYFSVFILNNRVEAEMITHYSAKLNQDEEPMTEVTDWQEGDVVSRKINVTNDGLTDGSYGNVYVRVQLREYLEIGMGYSKKTESHFLLDANGQFLAYETEAAAKQAHPTRTAERHRALGEAEDKWYVLAGSSVAGRQLPLAFVVAEPTKIPSEAAKEEPNSHAVQHWADISEDTAAIREVVTLGIGANEAGEGTISIESWDKVPTRKWLLDTSSEEGWAYWGAPLSVGETTTDILHQVTLESKPEGAFYYAVTGQMEVVNGEEFWSDAPEALVGAVTISPASKTVHPGGSAVFVEAVTGITQGHSVAWSISGQTQAETSIDEMGILTVSAQESIGTEIIVKATSLNGVTAGTSRVTVAYVEVTGVQVTPETLTLTSKGEAYRLNASVLPEGTLQKVVWSTDESGVVEVDELTGEVTAIKEGTAVVRAISEQNTEKVSACIVTVDITPTSIVVTPNNETLRVSGEKLQMEAEVLPEGTNQAVEWTSSDPTVVTVDMETGEVTAGEYGTATITATSIKAGSVKGTASVTVDVAATDILVEPSESILNNHGDTQQYTAVVKPIGASQSVTWSTSNESVATVDVETGVVTAKATGDATITATSTEDSSKKGTGAISIQIVPTSITVSAEQTILTYTGDTTVVSATVHPIGAPQNVIWTSSDEEIARVEPNTGVVTAVKYGTVTITAQSSEDATVVGVMEIEVDIAVSALSISSGDVILTSRGEQVKLFAFIEPSSADQTVEWHSSNQEVGEITADGMVTALNHGTTMITARSKKNSAISDEVNVIVRIAVTDVRLSADTVTLTETGQIVKVMAQVLPEGAVQAVEWGSSDESIATVDSNGNVTAGETIGVVNIMAWSKENSDVFGTIEMNRVNPSDAEAFRGLGVNDIAYAAGLEWVVVEVVGDRMLIVTRETQGSVVVSNTGYSGSSMRLAIDSFYENLPNSIKMITCQRELENEEDSGFFFALPLSTSESQNLNSTNMRTGNHWLLRTFSVSCSSGYVFNGIDAGGNSVSIHHGNYGAIRPSLLIDLTK